MSMNPYSDLTQPIYSAPDDQGVQTKYTQLDSATDAFQGGMYTAAEGVANSLGADGVRDWAGQNALANYQEAGQFVPTGPQRVEQIDSIGGAYDFAKNKFVENVPQMATTIGGTLLGAVTGGVPGAVIGGALTSAPSHLGEAYGRQKEEGIDNPMAMYGSAAINTGLDLIPSSAFVGAARRAAVKEMGKGSLARAVMTNVVAEAIPEAAQGIVVEGSVGNMPPPNVSTPEGEAYWMDRLNEAAAGGVVGGTMGGIGHAASYPTQILQQAKELPGSMYDQVSNRVTNTVNNFRSSPEEQAANKLAAQKKHEQYGFIGQSTDPAYIEKRANMTSYLQNKREQGLPLEPWEEQALMSLPQDDRRSLMANANNTRDVYSQYDEQNNEQTNTTGLNELGPQQLDQLAYAAMDGTLTPEDVSLIDNDLPDTQYAYIESKIAELSRRADSAPSLATDMNNGDNSRDTLAVDNSAPYSSQLDGLEEIAIDIVQGDITQGNSLKLDMLSDKEYAHVSDLVTAMEDNTGITAATPFSFDQDRLAKQAQLVDNSAGDTFEGPELQFTQGESLEGEGDFQDRPEATLQSRYEQMAGEKFLGTGKINESSKKDKLTGLKKRYDEVNYIMDPEKLQAALPNYTAKYTRDTIDKNNKTLDAYNTSGKNAYSYIPLSEALEKEVIRDMGSNAGAIDSNENSFASLLAARKETAAKDIMARATQKTGKLADYRQSLMDKGDYDTLIDLHQAIQSSPKDIIDNPTAFDYADRQKLEVGRTASNDASKDTTDMSLGYVPLANGKALNLPKALTKRMVQIQKAGDTTLTINEIYAQAKQGADATPEMQNLRRDALSSIMAEYSDELGSRLMNENDVIDLSPLSNMTKPERVKFTEDLRKLNINWVTDKKGKKHAGPYSLPNKVKKIVEVAATDKRIAESGFIPLQAKPNQNENTQTVLDLNKAIRLAQDHLKSKSLPSTEKDALQMVIANYRERLGNIPGEQSKVTLQTILEKAGAVINWKAPTGAVAEVDSRKQPEGIMGDQLFADNETSKRLLRSRTLDSKIAKLEDQLNSIDYRLDNDAMLQDTNEGLSQSDKINWANNEARRNDLNDKRELIRRKIQDATDEQFSQAKFDANQASKTPSYKDMSDYERGVATVIDALNKLVGVEKLTKPKKYGVYKNIERLGLKPKPLDPKTNKSRVYTSDQQEQLTRQGLNREIVDLALYDFGDITDAMDRVRTRNDLGSLDARDLEQEQGLELGAQEVRATNAMGKMGLENPSFDADEKAIMLNEQAQTTEKAGKNDVSSMSIPTDTRSKETLNNDLLVIDRSIIDTKALLSVLQTQSYDSDTNQDLRNAERYLKALEKRKAKILSRLESARYPITQDARAPSIPTEPAGKAKAPIKLSKAEQRNQYIQENSIDERKNAIAAQEYKIEQILLDNNIYKALSTRLDKLRSSLIITKQDAKIPKKLPEKSILRSIAKVEKELKAKRNSITERSAHIRNAQSKIVKLKEGIKLAKSKLTISPERVAAKAIKDIKVVNNPAKPINYKMTKAEHTLSKPKPKPKSKPTSSESKLNNGAVIRNELIIDGETVPLAYALNIEGIDKQLAVFKEPGKNLWMVTAIGDPRWITQNHSTRKEAIDVATDKIDKAGVANINKALNNAVDKIDSIEVNKLNKSLAVDKPKPKSKLKDGAVIRNEIIDNGEIVSLAYALNVEGIDKQLVVFKAPDTKLWLVAVVGNPNRITHSHDTRKEAINEAINRINRVGVERVNTVIKEAFDEAATPTENKGSTDTKLAYPKGIPSGMDISKIVHKDNFAMNYPTYKAKLRADVEQVQFIKQLMPTGDRTATTRAASQLLPVGSTFTVNGIPGVYKVVRIQKAGFDKETWSRLEGWAAEAFDMFGYQVQPKSWQMVFTRIDNNSKGNTSKSEKGFNTSNTPDSAALKKSTQALADKMLKSTGITARIVEGKEAEQVAERMGMDDYKVGMAYGSLHGFAESKPNKDGSYNVYINPAMQGKLREEILAHELGHITMYGSVMSRDSNAVEAQSVLNAFSTWLTKYGKNDTLYKDLISSKKSPEAALLYLQSGLGDYHMGVLGKETSSYLKEFDEWYADEAGKALLRKINKQAPVGLVQKYFNRLVDYLRKVFGKMSAVEQFLNRLDEQTRTSSVPAYNLSSTATPRDIKLAHTKFKREVDAKYNASISQMAKDLFLDKDWNLRAFKIPALTELADLFHKKRGDETTDNSYWSAKLVHMAKYDEHVTSIMRGASKEQQTKIMAELYNEKLNDNQVTKRAREIRSLFRDLEDYMGTVGIKINSRKNYFPEIADVEYVEKNEFAFKQMMAKYTKEMEGIAKKWNEDVEKRNHYLNQITQPNELMQASDVPQALYDNIVKGEGVYDESAVGQQTPNVRFVNHRIISFLKGRDKFEWETNYLQSSVTDATATYITQVVKRVEYEKRFGVLNKEEKADYVSYRMQSAGRRLLTPDDIANYHKESEHTNKLEWLLRRAQDQGATATQIQKARHYMAAEMGTLGRHTAQWLNDTLGLPMPPAHSPINKKAQALSSGLMSVANVWVLGMSTLTSLADPIGIAVRTGSMSQALSSFKTGLMASISKERSELKVLAEAVGSISDVATKEALAHGYNMAYMTPAVRRMNDWFFRAIGLEQWTQSTRLMAVDAAQGFLKRHDKKPTKHSKRFLRELGIMRGDIKYGRDGKVKVLSYEEYKKASEYDRESDDRLKSAIAEFVDGAILRPNPSQRPAWASDPHYALLFHLKSFMYAFQKTILNPLVHEAKQGNYMPLLMVASYIPVMIAVGMMKDVLKTAGDDDDNFTPTYKEGWDTFDYLWDGAEKGGLFGIMQPILDIQRDRRYGGSGIGAMYSPGLDPDTFDNLPVPFNYSYNNLFSG